jgi:uncharacterized membrane protein YjfL (UPF0719 family)
MDILRNYAMFFGYAIIGAIAMSIALAIVSKTWTWLSPINEWEELKKGNMAVAVVLSAVIIGFSLVVSFAILPGQ